MSLLLIDFGVVYFVLLIKNMGEEIADRVYFAKLEDCTHMATELNFNYLGTPLKAYCIPEVSKE